MSISHVIMSNHMTCRNNFKLLPKGPSLKALMHFFMRYSLLTCPRLWCEQDTFTILLPGPVLLMTGSSSQVSRKWEMKLTPSWYSNPSPVVQCGVSCNTVITVSILHLTLHHPVSGYLDPGAVDKDVHPALGLQHLGRKLPHRGEAGQVTVLNLELPLNKL